MKEIKLPKNWKIEKVSNIANLIRGINYKKETASNNSFFESLPILRANNINGDLNFEDLVYVPKSLIKSEQLIKKDDIIFAMSSGSKHLVGKTAVAKNDFKGSYGAFCALLRINEGINKKYVSYIFKGNNYRKLISEIAKGTSINNLKREHILDFEFPLPPLETQQAIVSKIEELFSELDKGIAELKTAQQQLKTYRQSVLKSAFEGKLTEEWRKNNVNIDSVESLIYNLKNDKKNLKTKTRSEITDEEQNELFSIPNSWKWIRNEEYLYEVKDGTHDTPKYISDGIPFVTQKNIKNSGLTLDDIQYISEEEHKKYYQRSNVTKGDILISMIGHNRGMSVIVDTDRVFSIKNVGLFKFNHKYQLNKFSYYFYQSKVALNIILKKSKGGAQPFIGLTELRNWPVVVCSLEEQYQIVEEIESRLSVADKMEQSIQESLQKAEALRQSILKKAFCGELV